MDALPAALAPLGAYRQFIARSGKVPVDYRTGRAADAHDPSIWADFQTIRAAGFEVGFVFTEADPFFFIDIDNCLTADGWSAVAVDLCARFAGAAVEVSQSGRGLHIIGQGAAPAHSCKADGFDLYTSRRYVALTGTHATGSADTQHDVALAALVAEHLAGPASLPGDWTSEPCAEWSGPADDDELIRRALKSTSASATFGGRASFADLWNADPAALGAAYPCDRGERPYDASAADAALAQHLAFWTGRNCERIERLMRRSRLARDKWDARGDYLARTITGACGRQRSVAQERERPAPAPADTRPAVTGGIVLASDLPAYFEGCIYVRDQHRVMVPGGHLLKPEQFKVQYGGRQLVIDAEGKVTDDAWKAFSLNLVYRPPIAESACFRPEHEPGALVDGRYANIWWPADVLEVPGDASRFTEHMRGLLPDDDDFEKYMAYLAACVQYPGRKFTWAPLLQGTKGIGKDAIIGVLTWALSERYVHIPDAADLDNKFNGWLQGKLLVAVDEIYSADRRAILDRMLAFVTNRRVPMQAKGQDQVTIDNRANFVFFSNHKDAIPIDKDERRYAIFYAAQQSADDIIKTGWGGRYFPDFYDWLRGEGVYSGKVPGYAHVSHMLRTWPIPDAINPATLAHRAPVTTSTPSALRESLGRVEQEIMEAVATEQPGFAGGWISSVMLERLLRGIRADRAVPRNKRAELLRRLGYVEVGRTTRIVSPDGSKPILYARDGHLALNLPDIEAQARAYGEAQSKAMFGEATQAV